MVLLEVMKQGSGSGMVRGIGLQTVEVHLGLFEWCEEAVRKNATEIQNRWISLRHKS